MDIVPDWSEFTQDSVMAPAFEGPPEIDPYNFTKDPGVHSFQVIFRYGHWSLQELVVETTDWHWAKDTFNRPAPVWLRQGNPSSSRKAKLVRDEIKF